MTERKNWTREEHIIAFNLYCKIPFSKLTKSHPQIIDLSKRLGRTPSSVSMKLCNFARLDPALKARNIKGLSQGAKGEEEVWNEFHGNWEDLAWQSELLLAKYENDEIIKSSDIDYSDLAIEGKEREAVIQARVNQSFFRKMILSSYNYTCAITGIKIPELLVASHIIPWKDRKETRINPQNGISLNALHDKAFDRGYITITADYKVLVSKELKNMPDKKSNEVFLKFDGCLINLPHRFLPQRDFLDYHYQNIFRK
jgi:putative restriction endonuclease